MAGSPSGRCPQGNRGYSSRKGELGERLKAVDLKAGPEIVWGDEMRLDLWNTVRKAWVPRGVR